MPVSASSFSALSTPASPLALWERARVRALRFRSSLAPCGRGDRLPFPSPLGEGQGEGDRPYSPADQKAASSCMQRKLFSYQGPADRNFCTYQHLRQLFTARPDALYSRAASTRPPVPRRSWERARGCFSRPSASFSNCQRPNPRGPAAMYIDEHYPPIIPARSEFCGAPHQEKIGREWARPYWYHWQSNH
jgi:hypothetical protein